MTRGADDYPTAHMRLKPIISPTPHASSKVLSAAANGLGDVLTAHGVEPARILATAGITEAELHDGLAGLDLASYCEMMERASEATRNDNFGLHFGSGFTPDRLGLIGKIVINSPTVQDSIKNLCYYFPYHQQNTAVVFSRKNGLNYLEYKIIDGYIVNRRQDSELTLGMYLNILRRLIGVSWNPEEVHFEHARPADWREHGSVFGADVHFGMPANVLVFRDLPARSRDESWQPERMNAWCDAIATLVGSKGALSLSQRVCGVLRGQLPSGAPHIVRVADELGLTRWTLQRKLAAEGYVFADLVDGIRRRLALLYLAQTHLPIAEVGHVLGYAEPTAFSRASVRWFDASPSAVRKRLVGEILPRF